MNRQETAKFLTIASTVYEVNLTPELVKTWHFAIGDIDFDLACKALKQVMRDSPYHKLMPAHIMTAIREDRKKNQLTAAEAWELASTIDPADLMKESRRAAAALRQVGGRRYLDMCDLSELPFIRNNFIKFYNELLDRDELVDRHTPEVKQIAGDPGVEKIGDTVKRLEVLKGEK